MYALLLGLAALLLFLYGANAFSRVDPRVLARRLKTTGGILLLAIAAGLALTGRFGLAVPAALLGSSLLGWHPMAASFPRRTRKSPGSRSEVRSAYLAMWLDHDTGSMGGRVLAGSHAGRALDDLDQGELFALLQECRSDPDSSSLLEAYLDRRSPGWREAFDPDAGRGKAAPRERSMTQEEAYQILGLEPGADEQAIRRAHRDLMKRLHPDQGGSPYLATRINQARDLLLARHGRRSG